MRRAPDATLQNFPRIVSIRAKVSDQFRFFLGANRFLGRSLHQAGNALGMVMMSLRNLSDLRLELRQQAQQLGLFIGRDISGRLNS